MATNHTEGTGHNFASRHIGPNLDQQQTMLKKIAGGKFSNCDDLIDKTIPKSILTRKDMALPEALSEHDALAKMKSFANENKIFKSYIGQGYYNTLVPPVIQRNVLENPGWYTQYTPYQSEIAQGRLEALINFQTVVADLTGLPLANASLLDEATAAAEAMALAFHQKKKTASNIFFIDHQCLAQTKAVIQTRAEPLGIEVVVGSPNQVDLANAPFGVLLQYPGADGTVRDDQSFISDAKQAGSMIVIAADLLSLAMLKSPGEIGADIAVGNTQRFGVPMGFGGPHAAYFATHDAYKRKIPGRIIGYSKDARGKNALRMALQTREQHIRRDKATSNICTSQVLLAIMASMYAVYHGPDGIKHIAHTTHRKAKLAASVLKTLGYTVKSSSFFDTVTASHSEQTIEDLKKRLTAAQINLFHQDETTFSFSFDESTSDQDVEQLVQLFAEASGKKVVLNDLKQDSAYDLDKKLLREDTFLQHPVFQKNHSETNMLRYIRRLESKDLSLTRSMIPLGSCTMKLNATAELFPITWPEFANIHPFAPSEQTIGYRKMIGELEQLLANITGFAKVSVQPNSGAQGEYAGLLTIRKYHQVQGNSHRNICLIPKSAHGTNPASAVMAGMKVVVVACDGDGNIDVDDLQKKSTEHSEQLAALMVTYPSTHGVFEEDITTICDIVHKHGGQVYMDGANMNAQIGLCFPGHFGPDVCHLNLHKTFCIPHGGGGPGVGPIGVAAHLAPMLPNHPCGEVGGEQGIGAVSAAPWGSACILPISLMYVWMMGKEGLIDATKVAILNANYIADRLQKHFPVLYRGRNELVAHECIIDLRQLKATSGIEVEDVAKRLIDYGFHAPTVSFPVAGTMMIEPTESESIDEIDRFCDAMIAIRAEIKAVEDGTSDRTNNLLKNAPHTAEALVSENWDQPYSRAQAVFPMPWIKEYKFWPSVARVDNAYGDRNLVCACLPLEDYQD